MGEDFSKNTSVHISSKSHLNLTFNLLQCGKNGILPGGRLSVGSTDSFTMVHVYGGEGLLETNGLTYRLGGGEGCFAFPDTACALRNPGPGALNSIWLSFTGYQVQNYLNRANVFRTKPIYRDREGIIGEKLNRIFTDSQRLPNRYCRMMSVLYDIFSCLLDRNPTRNLEGHTDHANYLAVKATGYIESNYGENLSVDEIASAMGISRKHLYTVFKDLLNMTPKQYLIYYRIEKACMRLKSTSRSVADIAESVGYANQFYFAKAFKQLIGMTPTEYRRNPYFTEVFSYRSFLSTLKEQNRDPSMDLPCEELILSVYTPPQPVIRAHGPAPPQGLSPSPPCPKPREKGEGRLPPK